jgi:LPS sulfotransferase NodH
LHDDPVIILTTGRSGSTLLQKLMNTRDDLVIWGEHAGFMNALAYAWQAVENCESIGTNTASGEWLLEMPRPLNVEAWPAWDVPFTKQSFLNDMRQMVSSQFAGKCDPGMRWGFKEIRYRSQAVLNLFMALYPSCKLLFLLRDPVDVCVSFASAKINKSNIPGRKHPRIVRDLAEEQIQPFFEFASSCLPGVRDRSLLLTYENLVAQPLASMDRIATFLGLETPFDAARIQAMMNVDIVSQRVATPPKLLRQLREYAEEHLSDESDCYLQLSEWQP